MALRTLKQYFYCRVILEIHFSPPNQISPYCMKQTEEMLNWLEQTSMHFTCWTLFPSTTMNRSANCKYLQATSQRSSWKTKDFCWMMGLGFLEESRVYVCRKFISKPNRVITFVFSLGLNPAATTFPPQRVKVYQVKPLLNRKRSNFFSSLVLTFPLKVSQKTTPCLTKKSWTSSPISSPWLLLVFPSAIVSFTSARSSLITLNSLETK